MLLVDEWIEAQTGEPKVRMLMQVHDELVFEVREDALQDVESNIQKLMESAAELDVPLVADAGHGDNWDQAH